MKKDGSLLIPLRFIILLAHAVVLGLLIWFKDSTIYGCSRQEALQTRFTLLDGISGPWLPDQQQRGTEMLWNTCVSIGAIVLEAISFLGGITMFNHVISGMSTTTHIIGFVGSALMVQGLLSCSAFWAFFVVGICVPFVIELAAALHFLLVSRTMP